MVKRVKRDYAGNITHTQEGWLYLAVVDWFVFKKNSHSWSNKAKKRNLIYL